jgi:hypothetical protein
VHGAYAEHGAVARIRRRDTHRTGRGS